MKKFRLVVNIAIVISLLSIVSICMAENDDGEDTYQAESVVDTTQAKYFFREGNKACKAGRYDEAISLYNKALEFNPNYSSAYANRGVAHERKGQYDNALDDYNEALRVEPNNAHAYNGIAVIYQKTKRQAEAKKTWKLAVQANPNFEEPYYHLGLVSQNNAAESIQYFKLFLLYAKPNDTRIADVKQTIQALQEDLQNPPKTEEHDVPDIQDNRFPAIWNGMKLTSTGTVPSKLSMDITLLTDTVIHGVIVKQPRTTISDNGTLTFYLNNGDWAGITFFRDSISFWFSWDGQKAFDTAIWNNGLYKNCYYNASIAFYVPGDGYLYVDVVPLNTALQSKSYKIELPEGAQYFNGKCRENVLIGEIGLYQ